MTSSRDDHERSQAAARRRLEHLLHASIEFGAIAVLGMMMLLASFTRSW